MRLFFATLYKSENMRTFRILIALTFSLLATETLHAQKIYYTPKGVIQISGTMMDSSVLLQSDEVAIILNYETAEFVVLIEVNSLRTGVDSLDRMLESIEDYTIRYRGHFDLAYIKTEKHLAQDFEASGNLIFDGHDAGIVKSRGRIEHFVEGTYPCFLTLSFRLNIADLEYFPALPRLGNELVIEINQAILDKEL